MKWRKEYQANRERKWDQAIGFLICLGVNLGLGVSAWYEQRTAAYLDPGTMITPWILNLALITLGLIFRPHFVVGYLATIALGITVSLWTGILIVTACFAGLATITLTENFIVSMVVGSLVILIGFCALGVLGIILLEYWLKGFSK